MAAALFILMFLLAGIGGAGVLIAFLVMAHAPRPSAAQALIGAGVRGRMDVAFQALAERVSEDQRRRGRPSLPDRLARAGLRLKPSEYMMAQAGCAIGLAFLGLLRFQVSLVVLLAAILGLFLPGLYVRFRAARRLKRLNSQLGDVLSMMANALKAGHSLPQALDLIARDARPPISEEFQRANRELQVGGSLETALTNLARRTGSDDLELMVIAILVQSSVGGNLAEMLETISHTLRERLRVKGEISALTAQTRMSSWIITLLPVALALIFFVFMPTYFRPMTQQPVGWLMLAAGAVLIVIGNLFIRTLVRVEI